MDAKTRQLLSKAWEKFKADDVQNIPTAQAGYYNYESTAPTLNRDYIFAPVYEDHRKQLNYGTRLELLRISNFLELNFGQYQELINCVARFAVGRGIIPTSAASGSSAYNDVADYTFSQWAENRFCDVENKKNFYQFTRFVVERLVADGEAFVVLTKTDSGHPQLQNISPLRVRSSKDDNDNSIDGIWYSPLGTPVAYNVFDLEDPDSSTSGGGSYTKVQAENMIHVMNPVASTQGHGVPWAQPSFNSMRDVKAAMDEVMNAVRNENLFGLTYGDPTGKGGPITVDGMNGNPNKVPKSVPTNTAQQSLPDLTNSQYRQKVAAGTLNKFVNVGYGELKCLKKETPGDNFSTLIELNYRDICQSVGIPYEFTYSPQKLNNKGGDIIIDKTRGFMAEVQEIVVDQFCQRVWGWVLSCQLDLDDVRPLGNTNPFTCTWTPPAKVGFGRNDTGNAIDALNNGIGTKKAYYGSLGQDWKVETDQWLDEEAFKQQRAKEKGVDLSKIIYGKGTIAAAAQDAPSTDSPTDSPDVDDEQDDTEQDDSDNEFKEES